MKKGLFSVAFMLLIIGSCNENRLYDTLIAPPGDLEWNRSDKLSFDIEIIDTSIEYNQFISFRHAVGYAFSACYLKIEETSPDGEITEYHTSVPIADSDGYSGDCHGDICDLEVLWLQNRTFNSPGVYHYQISHEMKQDKIHMVMLVGMILDKVGREDL
ncbi:MAG TPA: hypothetical protein DCX54_07065 [Flavobacteriales bacterium]|nr:hypothetical protein [Flavobacteriales bacterium]